MDMKPRHKLHQLWIIMGQVTYTMAIMETQTGYFAYIHEAVTCTSCFGKVECVIVQYRSSNPYVTVAQLCLGSFFCMSFSF